MTFDNIYRLNYFTRWINFLDEFKESFERDKEILKEINPNVSTTTDNPIWYLIETINEDLKDTKYQVGYHRKGGLMVLENGSHRASGWNNDEVFKLLTFLIECSYNDKIRKSYSHNEIENIYDNLHQEVPF